MLLIFKNFSVDKSHDCLKTEFVCGGWNLLLSTLIKEIIEGSNLRASRRQAFGVLCELQPVGFTKKQLQCSTNHFIIESDIIAREH